MIRRGSLVRTQPDPPRVPGGVAQLGEHLLCKQGVIGSIPFTSTNTLAAVWSLLDAIRKALFQRRLAVRSLERSAVL